MKNIFRLILLVLPFNVFAVNKDSLWVRQNYTKKEVYIPMRDGKRLFTAIYTPNSKSEKHPFLINRTPYSIYPYGNDSFRTFWNTHWMAYLKEGYIIVLQDVRGRMMSEGEFVDVRPYKYNKKNKETDEASDTYDTIEWLLKNVQGNNGRAGIFGISYPGFYSTMGALSGHPALNAASPQAPVTDWFAGDDFHHNGAFMLMDAFNFYTIFGKPRSGPTKQWGKAFEYPTKDNYKFYLEAGSLKDIAKLMGDSIAFWKDLYKHPNYDQWWQERDTRRHVQQIPANTATLVVGGLFDAEDCFGAWNLYQAIEQKAKNDNRLVMGPWAHGFWAKGTGEDLGNVRFGSKTAEWYQQNIEVPYFNYHLKGKGNINNIREANIFFTGNNEWKTFAQWPPREKVNVPVYLARNGKLSLSSPVQDKSFTTYISDPAKPVPYTEDIHFKRTKEYMTDDQRFAARRPDVLVFQTDVLEEDITLAGSVIADIFASISTTDADFVVKLIDVFPDDFQYDNAKTPAGTSYPMGGYQMLVRGEVMRGRYRNSLVSPEAFVKGQVEEVRFALPDVAHTFRKDHRLMVQIQSSWFPLVDRNPQKFVNIYTADKKDFVRSTIRIFHDEAHPSAIILPVLK